MNRPFPRRMALAILLAVACLPASAADLSKSLLRIRVTAQNWDFHRPWQKGAPGARESIGVLLPGKRVLVPANVVANATFVEFERIGSGDKRQATVDVVDYVANLALLKTDDDAFYDGMSSVKVADRVRTGDSLEAVQFEANDQADFSKGVLKDAAVVPYPFGVAAFLNFEIKIDLGQNFGGRMVPFFRRGKLAALGTGYSASKQTASAISAPVIRHFLDDAADGAYQGFPRGGFGYVGVEDPALRRYVGLGDEESGIFLTHVQPGSPADESGLQVGDVVTRINGYNVDKNGEYEDPDYGLIGASHLTTTRHKSGDVLDIHVVREGQRIIVPLTLDARDPATWPVEPFVLDRAPQFMIVGGFLIQELSIPFLEGWGSDWPDKAPRPLARIVRKQWDLAKPGEKFIILSQVIPTRGTVGYEDVRFQLIAKINGRTIKTMQDVAEAVQHPIDGFQHLQFDGGSPGDLYLHADVATKENAAIQQIYGLPILQRIE